MSISGKEGGSNIESKKCMDSDFCDFFDFVYLFLCCSRRRGNGRLFVCNDLLD